MKKKSLISIFCAMIMSLSIQAQTDIFDVKGGTISATYGADEVAKLIDGQNNTEFVFYGIANDIVYTIPGYYAIANYTLVSSSKDNKHDPKNWTLSGSVDGITWDLLDTQNNQLFTSRNQSRRYSSSVQNKQQPYKYVRLRITEMRGKDEKTGNLAEWKMNGTEKSVPLAPVDARLNPLKPSVLTLSWRDKSKGASKFEIQSSQNGKDFTRVASVEANTTTYVDKEINEGSSYIYRVCALSEDGKIKSAYAVSNSVLAVDTAALLTCITKGRAYTVTDQRNNSPKGEEVANAVDDNSSTKYCTYGSTTWVQLKFTKPYIATQYAIVSANDLPRRDPKNWQIEGSNDGTGWVILDKQTNQLFGTRFQRSVYRFQNETPYTYYRLNITANCGEGLTQFADWNIYADIDPDQDIVTPEKPANFTLEERSYSTVKLSWDGVSSATSYIIERSTDQNNWTLIREVPSGTTEWYPYALKPETTYYFRLTAVNEKDKSASAIVSCTTGKKEWPEVWENLDLWINDGPVTVKKVRSNEYCAFYTLSDEDAADISEVNYEAYEKNAEYVIKTYGDVLSDPRIFYIMFPQDAGGGIASIGHYRDHDWGYQNLVYVRAGRGGFQSTQKSGFVYDVPSHELCHIIEGIGAGIRGSVFFPVWKDSKWAPIFQYDIFLGIKSERAESWRDELMVDGVEFPTPGRLNYWFRDFFYPIYTQYGGTQVLLNFWELQGKYYMQRNGTFIKNGDMGELVHFFSGAAGVDVKKYAQRAFGWNTEYDVQLAEAKRNYPQITYAELIDSSETNVFQNGGTINANNSKANISRLTDNTTTSKYSVSKSGGDGDNLIITYVSPVPVKTTKYAVAVNGVPASSQPASIGLYGSVDGVNWEMIDTQSAPQYTNNKAIYPVEQENAYTNFKMELGYKGGRMEIAELELWGIEYPSIPYDLRLDRLSDNTVYMDWGCYSLEEIDHYEMERSENGTDFTKIADLGVYDVSYIDMDATSSKTYYYRVGVVNKSASKERVYSNVMNTKNLSGIEKENASKTLLSEVLRNLNNYPANQVKVHSVSGTLVYNNHYDSNDLLQLLELSLPAGVYIITIDLGDNSAELISGKVIISR